MTEGFASIITLLERRKTAIEQALGALQEVEGLAAPAKPTEVEPTATPDASARKGLKRSAAVRKRMQEAQQRRWAKVKGEIEPPPAPKVKGPKAKRKISAEGIKNIIAATKKRWRLVKAKAAAEASAALERAEAKKAAKKKPIAAKAAKKVAPVKKVTAGKSEPSPAPALEQAG
jgi:hypothetical protein